VYRKNKRKKNVKTFGGGSQKQSRGRATGERKNDQIKGLEGHGSQAKVENDG